MWDFGGQRLFSSLHHIFLTPEGIYLVVFDMTLLVPDGDPSRRRECLETLLLWCNSIFVFAGPKDEQQGAPVGTCLDKISSPSDLDAVCSSVENEVRNAHVAGFPVVQVVDRTDTIVTCTLCIVQYRWHSRQSHHVLPSQHSCFSPLRSLATHSRRVL